MRFLWFSILFPFLSFPQIPQPLWVTNIYDITSANQVQDMRSNTRQCNMFTFSVTSGTGNWGVQLEYSDTSSAGPWTVFGAGAAVAYTTPSTIGYGYGYHPFVRLNTTAGTTVVNLSCEKDFFFPSGGGTVTATSGPLAAGKILVGNGGADIATGNLSGDVTTNGSTVTTLTTVNGTPGSCGDATHVCQLTTNGKGLVTAQEAVAISASGAGAMFYSQSFENATSVSITHNLNSLNVVPEVYDTSGNQIGYGAFVRNDANDATLTFATPQSGSVVIMMSNSGSYIQSFTNATNVDVPHNLGTTTPLAAVYDTSGNQIGYTSLTPTNSNDATLAFATPQSGSIVLIKP